MGWGIHCAASIRILGSPSSSQGAKYFSAGRALRSWGSGEVGVLESEPVDRVVWKNQQDPFPLGLLEVDFVGEKIYLYIVLLPKIEGLGDAPCRTTQDPQHHPSLWHCLKVTEPLQTHGREAENGVTSFCNWMWFPARIMD